MLSWWVSIMKFSRAISQFNSTILRVRTEMVFKTLVYKKLNHLTWLIARENFIISNKVRLPKTDDFPLQGLDIGVTTIQCRNVLCYKTHNNPENLMDSLEWSDGIWRQKKWWLELAQDHIQCQAFVFTSTAESSGCTKKSVTYFIE